MPEIIIPKRYVHLSPSSLDDAQKCLTNFHNRMYNLAEKPEAQVKGGIFHRLLEEFYKNNASLSRNDSAEKAENTVRLENLNDNTIDVEMNEHLIDIFRLYIEHDINESWIVGSADDVECNGSIVLYDDEKLQILFEYIMDLQVSLPSRPELKIPVDHKTKGDSRPPTLRTNQFLGISFGQSADILFVNRINVQKSKPRAGEISRFEMYPVSYAESVLREWRDNAITTVFEILQAEASGFWRMSNSQCWNCMFTDVCNEPPDIREEMMRQKFILREKRDLYIKKEEDETQNS